MNCNNCGKPLKDNDVFCDRCGASVPAEFLPQPRTKRTNLPVIILLVLILAAIIGFGVFFAVRSTGDSDPEKAVIATEHQTDPAQTTETAATTPQATQTATESDGENAADSAIKATEAPFTISQQDLESEIEKIRKWYYTPSSEDEKIVLDNGADGWNYSRDYRFHNGKLVFAFIFDGTEEHRLYFKDDRMIRYIDEDHTTYDYPDCDKFSSWAEKALAEAYQNYKGNASSADTDDSEWIGTWKTDPGETMTVTAVTDSGFDVIYRHTTEQGSWIDSTYNMVFTDSARRTATESDDNASWKYTLTLSDGYLLVKSRYPDQKFYRE